MIAIIVAIIVGIVVLGLLIFFHEAGHFFAAKFFGVKVKEFGFGLPFFGRAWGFKRGETVYSLNWLPAGGFVSLEGEEGEETGPRSFASKSWVARALIIIAGIAVNIVVGIILFTMIVAGSGFKADFPLIFPNQFPFGTQTNYAFVASVDDNSPAKTAGLKAGDKILSADSQKFKEIKDFQNYVSSHKGDAITLEVQNLRENVKREVMVTPRLNPPKGQGALGVGLGEEAEVAYNSPLEKVFSGVLHSANLLEYQWVGISTLFNQSVAEKSISPISNQSSGPVGLVAIISLVLSAGGIESLIILANIAALISLMLGVFNLLPIPGMDGGRLFFIILEGIRGKKVSAKLENRIHATGLVVLIILFVLITFNDVLKIFTGRIFG